MKYELDLKEISYDTRTALAKERDEKLLNILSKVYPFGETGVALAENPCSTEEILDRLTTSSDYTVRKAAFQNDKTSGKAIEEAFLKEEREMIPDAIVLKIMVNHPNISTSFLEEHKYDKDIKDEVVAEIAIVLRKRMSEK